MRSSSARLTVAPSSSRLFGGLDGIRRPRQ
jgi:hypothetical protein